MTIAELATTVSNLVVVPGAYGCAITCTTSAAVCGQLQWGASSGSYPNRSPIETVPVTTHGSAQLTLCASGLTPSTTYHYILQWYDVNGNALDATADATFTTTAVPTPVNTPISGFPVNGPLTIQQSPNAQIQAASGNLQLGAGGFEWQIMTSGAFAAIVDNTWDIGASGANRPRFIYAGTNVAAANALTAGVALGIGVVSFTAGSGAPAAGAGNNGDYYFRNDTPGTSLQRIYVKSAGAWVGIV